MEHLKEMDYRYLCSCLEKMDSLYFQRQMKRYGSAEGLWYARDLSMSHEMAKEWQSAHTEESIALRMMQKEDMEIQGIRFLTPEDPEFPVPFLSLEDCPIGIYLQGTLPPKDAPVVAVIGARKCSAYGRNMADLLAEDLAHQGISVISGMAMGIDAVAQWSALEHGGYSMGILGCGVDICYPVSNLNLYRRLKKEGGILSEYPPGTKAFPFHFPQRNRLISALADITVVVEAREKSGTWITVDRALEQGKDVLAFPGRVGDPLSEGCNRLLAQGAGICLGIESVYEALGWTNEIVKSPLEAAAPAEKNWEEDTDKNSFETRILSLMNSDPIHMDLLVRQSGSSIQEVALALWNLERKGRIRQNTPNTYQKIKK